LREKVPRYEQDRIHYPDIAAATELIASGAVIDVVEHALGGKGALL
jgi:histidine ammonia-lyase